MDQPGTNEVPILPPAVTSITNEARPGAHAMQRTFSQDIQVGTEELKAAAEQTRNIILDLGLDGVIRWVSPSWTDVVKTELDAVKGKPISSFITDKPTIFETAIEKLKSNDSKSQFVRFKIKIGADSDLSHMLREDERPAQDDVESEQDDVKAEHDSQLQTLELEGQGIMVYDRPSGGESHTMWMLQPAAEPIQITIALPGTLVESLGIGAEVLAKHLTELAESGANDPENHPPPMPILCRVCERDIVPWWFEKHSDLCVQEHKAEMDCQMIQENLAEHRHAIVKVLDAFEARNVRPTSAEQSPAILPRPEYKGIPIGPASTPSSGMSSHLASNTASPNRSRSPSALGLGHARSRSSFAPRRPLTRIVELILDLCDTALEINPPAIKETKTEHDEEFRTQSPQSESRISQVLSWQQPSSLENEPGLAQLSFDTERMAKSKVEAIHRHQVILEYSERIRQETIAEVDACIAEALQKAERLAHGELLSSGESDLEIEELEAESYHGELIDEPTPMPIDRPSSVNETQPYVGARSMAQALRSTPELPISLGENRRTSSVAVSTRSSSPMECPTPKSHKSSSLIQPQPTSNRRSMYIESDANDSDSSLPSSILSSQWRTDSPASDQVLSRTTSSRDRDRKRRSMHLHGLGSGSPRRHQSPGRYPQPPPSPLRMTKSRIPSADHNTASPVVSPLLTTGEFMNPPVSSHHHRRQSSVHSSQVGGGPQSPRMSSISQPQARIQAPSIKDFEIIKPISRGAFGSVYLSKKKLTGEYFAIKTLRKTDMVAKNQVSNVKAERAIMMWQGESDFVAKLYWTFSSKEHLFLVMEYLNGGDCASLVKILGGLSEDWAKKYIAEVVLGVEHLHSRGIVHRDLKPDNLLIDSKGHLKLTDFGLSRMGLVGRQKRALEIKSPEDSNPDLLKQGPFVRSTSGTTSRSASFDFHGSASPNNTPLMTPALASALEQPSYFSLNRDSSLSREQSRRASGYRSDSGSLSTSDLHRAFRAFSIHDPGDLHSNSVPIPQRGGLIEEEAYSAGSASPDIFPLSQSMSNIARAPPPSESTSQMLPPPMALFDPEDSKRRFVGTPDYLAPETINGSGQDEMSDWWSLGCILFEFLYGYPPFNAETQEEVFENILHRRIHWPDSEDDEVVISEDARDLINKLIQLDPQSRLGANVDEKYPSGGAEIQAHPWFSDINWATLLEDEAQFVPNPENPEDTEYFDARGATLQTFPEEIEDQLSPALTPGGSELNDRPHDALLRARNQIISGKRGLMPLHIPPHVARDSRSRRLSEPVIADDFGNFTFKNLPVLEKANKDIVEKMKKDAMQAQMRGINSQAVSLSNSPAPSSPAGPLEGSPMLPMPVKRAISISKGHRPASPSGLGNSTSSPGRPIPPSLPSSPLLVQFSTQQHHERRKTSSSSHGSSGHGSGSSLQPGNFFESIKDANGNILSSSASSPIKHSRMSAVSPAKTLGLPQRQSSTSSRARSQTVGSQEGEAVPRPEGFVPNHHKRRSQLFAHEVSPSSSDTENTAAQALLKVQRKRNSLRRMSQINLMDGPSYRPLDILICEDHPVSKMVMERLFGKMGCRTITASNGSEALRLAVSQLQFDIIFLEYRLPLINGVDVSRMIRDTRSANTHTPIVCMTGYLRDLPTEHHFDTLIQKPPTVAKLNEVLEKFCSWKAASKDFKFTTPLVIPHNLRYENPLVQDSPSSIASSQAPTMPESSWKGSSRQDSISSGVFSDFDSTKADDVPSIISRPPTDEWQRESGLGISHDIVMGQKPYIRQAPPRLIHTESAPVTAPVPEEAPTGSKLGVQTPRKRRSSEAIKAKRESLEKKRVQGASAESGDDEDEELGRVTSRGKSPLGKSVRTSSKLGQEMMRTNSRGSVISNMDDSGAEPTNLRKSLEILEERMEGLRIPEEPDQAALLTSQPRKMERTASQHSHPEPEGLTPERPQSRGHITPPVIFPQKPGDTVKEIDMDSEATPMPSRTMSIEDEELTLRPSDFVDDPTPRPQGSPAGPSSTR
jgi:serine/threonine-protein kinase RIM15